MGRRRSGLSPTYAVSFDNHIFKCVWAFMRVMTNGQAEGGREGVPLVFVFLRDPITLFTGRFEETMKTAEQLGRRAGQRFEISISRLIALSPTNAVSFT